LDVVGLLIDHSRSEGATTAIDMWM